jgi:hypothetical protein
MTTRKRASEQLRPWNRYICKKLSGKLRRWSPRRYKDSILGTVVLVGRMSRAESLIRKKVHRLVEAGFCHQNQHIAQQNKQVEEEKDEENRKKEGFWQRGDAYKVEDDWGFAYSLQVMVSMVG